MDFKSIYQSKLTTPADAVARIGSGSNISMGMAMTEPPALLKALADRASARNVDDLKVYYFESTPIAGETILRYELGDRIHPYCMFISPVERALIKKGEQNGGRKVLTYVPSNFSQSPRILTEHIGNSAPTVIARHQGCTTKTSKLATYSSTGQVERLPTWTTFG